MGEKCWSPFGFIRFLREARPPEVPAVVRGGRHGGIGEAEVLVAVSGRFSRDVLGMDARAGRERSWAKRVWSVMAALLVGAMFVDSTSAEPESGHAGDSLAGLTLTYRFENGRIYRAAYAEEMVHLELLEPRQAAPTSAPLPYREEMLREGLFLVVWDDPSFHTTFVIDLEHRRIHASAMRAREGSFFGVARIVSVSIGEPKLPRHDESEAIPEALVPEPWAVSPPNESLQRAGSELGAIDAGIDSLLASIAGLQHAGAWKRPLSSRLLAATRHCGPQIADSNSGRLPMGADHSSTI